MLPAIEVKNITKTFPGVLALDDVSLKVQKNEVHALVGENGAGKSTLMKILGGVYAADKGEVFINGEKTVIKGIDSSKKAGIAVIYQEFNLMPELTVAENIYVTDLPLKKGFLDYGMLNKKAKELLDVLEIDISPKAVVADLRVAEKQMVEICKALSSDAEIIIMDEPTAMLNNNEVERLYGIIRKLKSQGKTIVYISHRMKEIFDITDTVSVLRDGKYIGTKPTAELDGEQIVRMMVGRDASSYYSYDLPETGEKVLEVKGLTKEGVFHNISFTVHRGEILGVAGLMGSGREEIMKAIYGLIRPDSGEVILKGEKLSVKNPRQALKHGISYVTDDRKDEGIFEQMSVRSNLTINVIYRIAKAFGLNISPAIENELLDEYTEFMNMKYSDEYQEIRNLSGGNQQKFLLARALASNCEVLLLLEPTRGIDVGAKAEIYNLLTELAKKGMAIVVVSSELQEIISVCHRTLVVWQGKLTGELAKSEMREESIMMFATGTTKKGGAEE